MTVDMNSADSIRAWLAIAPDRHLPQLRALWRLFPQWRESIEAAIPEKAKRSRAPRKGQGNLL